MKRAWFASFRPDPAAERWRRKVGGVVEDLVASLGGAGEPLDAIRAKVIRAAREALGGEPSRELVGEMMDSLLAGDGDGPFEESAFPGLLRDELDSSGWPWGTPAGAESVMAVVEQALADQLRSPVPPYWARCLGVAARLVAVQEYRADTPRVPLARSVLLEKVMDFATESLGDSGEGLGWDGGPIDLDGPAPPDLFRRLTRSLDGGDPEVVAVALAIIRTAAGDELARPVPGEGPAVR